MRIAVCDDEQTVREELARLILRCDDECMVDVFDTASPVLSGSMEYDILFLDIQMPGTTGVEAARALRERGWDTEIIFITALKEYALEAFDVSAFSYLVKPIDPDRFREVFLRAEELCRRKKADRGGEIFIHTRQDHIRLKKREVLYAESQLRKVSLHTPNGCFELYATMDEAATMLGDGFFRCHRSYIVNLGAVTRYGNEEITLNNGETINLSRHRYQDFVRIYMRYLKAGGVGFVD